MFRYICIIFREPYASTVVKLQKPLRIPTQYNQYIKMFAYEIVTVDDDMKPTERCELSTVIIIAWWLYIQSGLSYGCNSYVGVLVCGYVETPWRWCRCIGTCSSTHGIENTVNIYIYIVQWLVWIIIQDTRYIRQNKPYKMHVHTSE